MSKEFARTFYNSTAWKDCREAFKKQRRYLCEECLKKGMLVPGEIVHHKAELTPNNIDDPSITLNFDNLKLVCRECHAKEHGARQRRYKVDEFGRVISID